VAEGALKTTYGGLGLVGMDEDRGLWGMGEVERGVMRV